MNCKNIGKGVWIDLNILGIEDLSWTKKIILAEIVYLELDREDGIVIPNSYFVNKFKFQKASVSRALTELEKKGYIELDKTKEIRNYGRIIKVIFEYEPLTIITKERKERTASYHDVSVTAFDVLWSSHSEYRKQFGNEKHGKKGDAKKLYLGIIEDIKQTFFDKLTLEDMYKVYSAISEFVEKYKMGLKTKYLQNILDSDTIIDEIEEGVIGND